MGVENTRQSALDELSHLETMPLLHFLAHFGRTFQNATLNFLVPILPHHVLYLLDTSAQMACPGRKFPDCGLQTSTTKAPSPHKTLPGLRESGARKEGRWAAPAGPPSIYRESGSGARSPSAGNEPESPIGLAGQQGTVGTQLRAPAGAVRELGLTGPRAADPARVDLSPPLPDRLPPSFAGLLGMPS